MFRLLLTILALKCAQAQIGFTSVPCSQRNPKIVGGSEAAKHEMPFMVSLMRRGGHFCGGTIIHERWVLTAGHCICNGLNNFMKPAQIQGVMGLHSINNFLNGIGGESSDGAVQTYFKNIVPHPNYECTSVNNDIALLEMVQPVRFSAYIQPTCLSADSELRSYENEFATVSGWGWTHENQEQGKRPDVLRKAAVRVWNNNECELSYKSNGKSNRISESQLCAGFAQGGIDSCWADSGGPLMSKENMLLGVVSTGIGCARPGLPGIYTRVSKYAQWIESVILDRRT